MLSFWSQIMVCVLVLGARCVFRRDQKKTSKVDPSTYTYTHTHTYIHTSMHACIHTSVHTYIHTFIHSYIHTFIHSYIHTYIHTFIHSYIHTYIHADTHTHIHTHISIIYTHTLGQFRFGDGRNQKGKRLRKIRVALGPSCLMGG